MKRDPERARMHESFEAVFGRERPRLVRLAHRILRDPNLAEDVVQQSWLKLVRQPGEAVESIGAWLTTVVTRTCIDTLRQSRRQTGTRTLELDDPAAAKEAAQIVGDEGPEQAAMIADTIGTALLVVLDRLAPLERVAFVLHDVMALPFSEIAPLIERSPAATRQLASRARRRVRGGATEPGTAIARQKRLAERFIDAANRGDIAALLEILAPDVTLEMDARAAQMASSERLVGAEQVARFFSGRAKAAHVARIGDAIGLIVAPQDRLTLVLVLGFARNRITTLRAAADPYALRGVRIALA